MMLVGFLRHQRQQRRRQCAFVVVSMNSSTRNSSRRRRLRPDDSSVVVGGGCRTSSNGRKNRGCSNGGGDSVFGGSSRTPIYDRSMNVYQPQQQLLLQQCWWRTLITTPTTTTTTLSGRMMHDFRRRRILQDDVPRYQQPHLINLSMTSLDQYRNRRQQQQQQQQQQIDQSGLTTTFHRRHYHRCTSSSSNIPCTVTSRRFHHNNHYHHDDYFYNTKYKTNSCSEFSTTTTSVTPSIPPTDATTTTTSVTSGNNDNINDNAIIEDDGRTSHTVHIDSYEATTMTTTSTTTTFPTVDVDEIDTSSINQPPPPLTFVSPLPTTDLNNTDHDNDEYTTSASSKSISSRPKATSRIEFDQDDSYYNDYCSILNTEEEDDFDESNVQIDYDQNGSGGIEHQSPGLPLPSTTTTSTTTTTNLLDPAINTMSTVAAIAHGTFSAAAYYGNLSSTLGGSSTATTMNNNNNDSSTNNNVQQQQQGHPPLGNQQQLPRRRYNIYDVDADMIREIKNIDDIADLVTQIENMESLIGRDIRPLLIPMSRITSQKRFGEFGAKLTERLLLTCLGRLPITIFDRYTKANTYIETTIPNNKFSTVLDTREWLPPPTTTTSDNGSTGSTMDGTTNATKDEKLETPRQNILTATPPPPIRILSKLSYPTESLYTRAIIAWGNLANGAGLMRAEGMFQLQIEEYVRELEFVRYHQMKNRQQQLKNQRDPASNTLPFQGLNPELQLPPEPFASPPGRRAYKSLVRAWAVSGEKNGAAKAYELLREMEHLSGVQEILHQPRDTSLRPLPPIPPIEMPDIGTYNVVLSVYAKSSVLHQPIVLERVKKIIQRIRDLQEATGSSEYYLDAYSYLAVLQTYGKYVNSCPAPLEYAYLDEIYTVIRDIHGEIERRKSLPPDYHTRMNAMKRGMDLNKVPKKNQRDLSIFFPMSMSWAYGVLIEALLKSAPLYRTILIADDIVVAMTGRKNRINTPPSTGSSNFGFASDNNLNNARSALPVHIPYEICTNVWPQYDTLMQVVEGWGRSGLPSANARIEQLIHVVVADSHYPRLYFLHEAMESWCNSAWQFAPRIVENLLQRGLENSTHVHNKPTGQTFAIALKAWLNSKEPYAPHRAELLFQHLLHLYEVREDSWYKPREVHLRYMMTSWINRCKTGETYDGISGKDLYPAEHCEQIVYWIRGRSWFQSAAFFENVYGLAIRAWAVQAIPDSTENDPNVAAVDSLDLKNKLSALKTRSQLPNPIEHSVQLLNSFAELKVSRGDVIPPYTCNWVLETCCQVQTTIERKVQAYETAIQTFQKCRHNARTYVLLVQVIRIQISDDGLDDSHRTLIEEIFRKCCMEGLVSQDMIVHVVSTAKSPETIQRVFGLSYQIAQLILQQREVHMSGYVLYTHDNTTRSKNATAANNNKNTHHLKNFDRLPTALQVQNLPKEWSANAVKKDKVAATKENDTKLKNKNTW